MPLGLHKNAKVELISSVPLFAGLTKAELGQIASIADEVDFPADKVLIREGERGREFFVLLDGDVEVRRGTRKLSGTSVGEFFGEMALISNQPRNATVTTTSPVRVLVIRDVEFRALLQQTPQIAIKLLEVFAARLPPE
jgi:CRP-like cAMP-binding protein